MLAFTLASTVLLALGATSVPTESVRKCRNVVQKEPVIFVDGHRTLDSAYTRLSPSELRSVGVLCISPIDSTVLGAGSLTLGLGAIVIWTTRGPSSRLEPALAAVTEAQRAHFARTGTYGRELASLDLDALPAEVKIVMETTSEGWSATAKLDRRFSPQCRVSDGKAGRPEMTTNGAVVCSD